MPQFDSARAEYLERGHAVVRGVVEPATVLAAHDHLASLLADDPRSAPGIVTAPVDRDPFFAEIVQHAGLVAVATALLGSDATAFGCTYLVKPPHVGLPVLWHQDGHPWRDQLDGRAALTLWVALDDATVENGCLRVLPRTHHVPAEALRPQTSPPNLFGVEVDPAKVDPDAAVAVELRAGDVSAHHPDLIHGSEANTSDRPRTALAVRYRT